MTDTPKNLGQVYPPGAPFRLESVAPHDGAARPATVITASPINAPGAVDAFVVWGSLHEYVSQITADQLPVIVTLAKAQLLSEGQMVTKWHLLPHGPAAVKGVPQTADPAAHLDPTLSAPPNPVPPVRPPGPEPPESGDAPAPLPPAAPPNLGGFDPEAPAF